MAKPAQTAFWTLSNQSMKLVVDSNGGAISALSLNNNNINPLSFLMDREQINQGPTQNKYKGHFICSGRWGDATPGEINAGIKKHGELACIDWELIHESEGIETLACSEKDALTLNRKLSLDPVSPCFLSKETFKNTNSLSRLFNIVQHPTIAAPFLSSSTIIDCNAGTGFRNLEKHPDSFPYQQWPYACKSDGSIINIRQSPQDSTGVYSFVIPESEELGWITAYEPQFNLLVGYLWKRKTYPWINHWLHCENGVIKFRGLEFGTTGLHMPYTEIIEKKLYQVLKEDSFHLLDAGENKSYEYIGFIQTVPEKFNGVESLSFNKGSIKIQEQNSSNALYLSTQLNFSK